ncbi:hypothetical protein EW145_g8050, partial [Phellinidium pouzarii]
MSDSRHTRPATTKRSQQTDDDEGRKTKKKAEAHLQLEYIDAKYDDLDDAAHAALDIKTQKVISEYGDELNGADIVISVVSTCNRLLQDGVSLHKIRKKFGDALDTLAKDAHNIGSYKSIRNLVVLQKNVNLINPKLDHNGMDVGPLNEDVREMQ